MKAVGGQHSRHTLFDPERLGEALALGAMAVAAGVVGDLGVAARCAHVGMSAELGRPAAGDVAQDGVLLGRQGVRALEGFPVSTDDVRDFQRGPVQGARAGGGGVRVAHLSSPRSRGRPELVERAGGGA